MAQQRGVHQPATPSAADASLLCAPHSLPLQVYGAVTMNNTLVLGLFLLVVWIQRLEWVYSSEVAVIVSATLAIGALGVSRNTFRAWLAVPALLLYPASLAGVYALDTFLGWQ